MKKTIKFSSLALILLAAASCQTTTSSTETQSEQPTTSTKSESQFSDQIVYINSDSLYSGYELYKELRVKFDTKAQKSQKELENKGRSLERKVKDFQYKIEKGLITRAQAAETEQNLNKEQQQLLQFREQSLAALQEEEQVMFNNMGENINQYLKKYNAIKKYKLILNTNAITNAVFIGDPSLDITKDVLEGLNKEHKASKK